MVVAAVIQEELHQLRQSEISIIRAINSLKKGVTELEEQRDAHDRTLRLYREELQNMKAAPAVRLLTYRDVKSMEKDAATLISHIDNQILEKLAFQREKTKELEVTRANIRRQEHLLAEFGRFYEFPSYDQ